MTMHLEHPALTTTGKRTGKVKWASAEAKQKHNELAALWNTKMSEWQKLSKPVKHAPARMSAENLMPKIPPGRFSTKNIPSVDSGHIGAVASKPAQMYTGTKIIGIGTLHKSNAVPVFSDEEAKDMARMRRG